MQLIFAGKAHPQDQREGIHRPDMADERVLRGDISIAYLPNYDMH
jgi:glucan phosphorylase